MAVEMVGAVVALRSGEAVPEYSAEAVLVRSACRTLLNTPRGLIDAMTVSLPAGDAKRLADLQALCRRLAIEHRLRVDIAVKEAHLKVRITRPALELVGEHR
jgi:hypothetical protein